MVNSSDNLTLEETAVFQITVIKVKMDEAQNEIMIVMSSPFSHAAGLMEIEKNFTTVLNKLKAFEEASGEQAKIEEHGGKMKMYTTLANPVEDQFTFMVGRGSISKSISNIQALGDKIAKD